MAAGTSYLGELDAAINTLRTEDYSAPRGRWYVATERLSNGEVTGALVGLQGWERRGDVISKQFTFDDFRAALTFVNRVGELAEAADHHPDITINYRRVTLSLSTHDVGGLTAKDIDLASQIEALRP